MRERTEEISGQLGRLMTANQELISANQELTTLSVHHRSAHDELVIEADQDQAEPATGWLRAAMIDGMKPLLDPIPVTVEISVGESWRLSDRVG